MSLFNFLKLVLLFIVLFNIASCGSKKKKELKDYQLNVDNLGEDPLLARDKSKVISQSDSEEESDSEDKDNKNKNKNKNKNNSTIDYNDVANSKKKKEKEDKELYHLVNKNKKTKRGGLKMPTNFNDNFTINRIEKYGYVTTVIVKMPLINYVTQTLEEKKDITPDRYQSKFRKYPINPKISDSIKDTISVYTNYINTFNNDKTIITLYIYDSGTSLDFSVEEKLALKNFVFNLKNYITTLNPNKYYIQIVPIEGVQFGEIFILSKKYDGELSPNAYFLNKTNSLDSKSWFEKIGEKETIKNNTKDDLDSNKNNKYDTEIEKLNININ